MADFSILTAIGLVLRTWPFLLLRVALSGAIVLGYAAWVGGGAGLGAVSGAVLGAPGEGAAYGAAGGFVLASALLIWLRAYLLYLVKGGHIAVLVAAHDGQPLPRGFGQIAYALDVLKARFAEVNVLFVLDGLIRGVLRTICGLITALAGLVGLRPVANVLNAVLYVSTMFVDELILARNIRTGGDPFSGAQDALVLYAQNAVAILRNAVVLTLVMALLAAGLFALVVGPFGALAALFPGPLAYAGVALAGIAALTLVYAVAEPFCIACLLQVFIAVTDGQQPDPEWRGRLEGASARFRDLGARAIR